MTRVKGVSLSMPSGNANYETALTAEEIDTSTTGKYDLATQKPFLVPMGEPPMIAGNDEQWKKYLFDSFKFIGQAFDFIKNVYEYSEVSPSYKSWLQESAQEEIAKGSGVSRSFVQKHMGGFRRYHLEQQRVKVIELNDSGDYSLRALAKETGIPKSTVKRWIDEVLFPEGRPKKKTTLGLPDRSVEDVPDVMKQANDEVSHFATKNKMGHFEMTDEQLIDHLQDVNEKVAENTLNIERSNVEHGTQDVEQPIKTRPCEMTLDEIMKDKTAKDLAEWIQFLDFDKKQLEIELSNS